MAIAAVVLTLVDDEPVRRAGVLSALARRPGLSLLAGAEGPRVPAVLEAPDAELEQSFLELRAADGVADLALACAWIEQDSEHDDGRDR